jgi:hypothetical protein
MARQVDDQTAYAASYRDPVRASNPYTPTQLVTSGATSNVPIIGVAVVAGVILLLEHRRRRRGR